MRIEQYQQGEPSDPPAQAPEPVDAQPKEWTPQKLPTTGVHTATYSLPVHLLKQIHDEVYAARIDGFNRTKSALVAEALEMYFSQNRKPND